MNYHELTPRQKAAIALIAFGPDVSSKILKDMSESEIEAITVEIANMHDVSPEIEEKIVDECHNIFMAGEYISSGGVDFARKMLNQAVGNSEADNILRRLEPSIKSTGFAMLKNIDPKQLTHFLQNEHPQTIALILTQIDQNKAAAILQELSPELQAEVSLRIALMEKIAPEILTEIEQTLKGYFEQSHSGEMSASGGAKSIAGILNLIDPMAEKNILRSLEAENPSLASEIKNMMFVFDDVLLLDDRSVQRLLKEIEMKDLALALKATSDDVKDKFFSNVSERVRLLIKEEIEYMGPTRLTEVEMSQARIVDVIRRLEEDGQILVTNRGGKEEILV